MLVHRDPASPLAHASARKKADRQERMKCQTVSNGIHGADDFVFCVKGVDRRDGPKDLFLRAPTCRGKPSDDRRFIEGAFGEGRWQVGSLPSTRDLTSFIRSFVSLSAGHEEREGTGWLPSFSARATYDSTFFLCSRDTSDPKLLVRGSPGTY